MGKQTKSQEKKGQNVSGTSPTQSSRTAVTGIQDGAGDTSTGEWTKVVKKRQRRSTGGTYVSTMHDSSGIEVSKSDFIKLNTDDKLVKMFEMLTCMNPLSARVSTVEERVATLNRSNQSSECRIQTLEYKSIDLEARGRRQNLLFRGIPESRSAEICEEIVKCFLKTHLDLDPDSIYIQRAHRLGRARKSNRPIIAYFRDYPMVEQILSSAYKLKDKPSLGINRDYPKEIVEARSRLWPLFKEARSNNPKGTVHIGYPAKLIVRNSVVQDEFPNWNEYIGRSRVHSEPTRPQPVPQPQEETANVPVSSMDVVPESEDDTEPEGESPDTEEDQPDHYSQAMLQLQAQQDKALPQQPPPTQQRKPRPPAADSAASSSTDPRSPP